MEDKPTASSTSPYGDTLKSRTLVASFLARPLGWEGAALCMGSSLVGPPDGTTHLGEPGSQPVAAKRHSPQSAASMTLPSIPAACCEDFVKLVCVNRSTGAGGQRVQQQATTETETEKFIIHGVLGWGEYTTGLKGPHKDIKAESRERLDP